MATNKRPARSFSPGLVCLTTIASLCGPMIFIVVTAVLGIIQPGYNPVYRTVSSLVWGPHGWMQTLAFIIFGFLMTVFAIRFYYEFRSASENVKYSVTVFLLVSAGFFIIGIFPGQRSGTAVTLATTIHWNTTKIISLLFPAGCLLAGLSFRNNARWRGFYIYTIIAVFISFCLIILGLVTALKAPWMGLYERIYLLNGFIWIEVISIRLLYICLIESRNQGK